MVKPLAGLIAAGCLAGALVSGPTGGNVPYRPLVDGLPDPFTVVQRVLQEPQDAGPPHRPLTESAVRQDAELERLTTRVAPELADAPWTRLGPANFGGRVADIALDPRDGNTLYLGTASGGVWKSTDGGVSFLPAWPLRAPQAVGAIATAPDGTIYAGTGEANPGGGGITFGGNGIYRSKDGGQTWRNMGLPNSGTFGRIVVDPTKPKRIYAAATGDLFNPGGERGLYRSVNGGKTWELILEGINDTTGAVDVAISPGDPKRILVAMWDHQRLATHRVYGGVGSGLFLTRNGGKSWKKITEIQGPTPVDTGRIGVAFSRSNPDRAYAVAADLSGDALGLWRSEDGGSSWTRTAADPSDLSQSTFSWWFGRIFVDPDEPDRLFVAGVELIESIDGGDTFLAQTVSLVGIVAGVFQAGPTLHPDQHAMAWDPTLPGRVYLGNDGGVYWSVTDGKAASWVASAAQGWTQHYSVGVSEQEPSRVVSGLQDNLCQRNYLAGAIGLPNTWTKYGLCGDGLQTLINFEDDNIVYGCAQYGGNCSKTVDGGGAFTFLGDVTSQRFGWWAPMVFDPNDADIMYTGGNIVNRSTDGGDTWTAISPDLTTNPVQLDPSPGYRIYGTITTIAVSKADPEVIYVGTDDAQLWRTEDTGKTWTKMKDPSLPKDWVTSVAADPEDPKVAYVTYSGFRGGKKRSQVLMTRDAGRNWEDISTNLPQAPVNDVIIVPEGLVVGTDTGVYVRRYTSTKWLKLGSGLPMTPVFDLRYHQGTSTVTIATFGHGIQRVALPPG